jgi:DNA polymerase-3 subunit delta
LVSVATTKARWKKVHEALEAGNSARAMDLVSRVLSDLNLGPEDLTGSSETQIRQALDWPRDLSIESFMKFLEANREKLGPVEPVNRGSGEGILSWLAQRADPSCSVLIIESELVDRRGSFYKKIKRYGPVLDLDREKRDKRRGEDLARDLISKWFSEKEVEIGPQAINCILERIGHEDLVALKTEVKKLLSQAKRHTTVRIQDVQDLVVRHREEELYQLTDALGKRDLDRCLSSLDYLLNQGIHPLAILQTIANFLRRMIVLRSCIEYGPGLMAVKNMSYDTFKNKTLPHIKASLGDVLPMAFKTAHPYVLYKMSRHLDGFEMAHMLDLMSSMAELDLRLKGNQVPDRVIIEGLIFRLIPSKDHPQRSSNS